MHILSNKLELLISPLKAGMLIKTTTPASSLTVWCSGEPSSRSDNGPNVEWRRRQRAVGCAPHSTSCLPARQLVPLGNKPINSCTGNLPLNRCVSVKNDKSTGDVCVMTVPSGIRPVPFKNTIQMKIHPSRPDGRTFFYLPSSIYYANRAFVTEPCV